MTGDMAKMKKHMAFAIMALTGSAMAQSTNGVQIYGIADVALTHISNTGGNSRTGLDSGGASSSRIGLRGREDLGGGLQVGFTLESTVDLTNGSAGRSTSFFNRESTVSLISKDWGTLKVGRQLDFLNVDIGVPDAAPIIQGGQAAGYAGIAGAPVDVHIGGYQFDNTVKWMKTFGRVTTGLLYGFGAGTETKGKYVHGAMINYIDGGLSLGAGYTKDNFSPSNGPFAREAFAVKGMYVTGPWMFLANYYVGKDPESKAQIKPIELTVAYNFSEKVRVGGGIGVARATNKTGEKATLTQPFIGAKYNLSKRTHLYTMASLNTTSDKDAAPSTVGKPGGALFGTSTTDQQTVIRVGIHHRF